MKPAPIVGSQTDMDSAIVICAMFPRPDAPAPEVPFSYAVLRERETTLIPLEWERHLTTTQLVVAANPSSGRIQSNRGASLHEFSRENYHEEVCDDRATDMRFASLLVGGPRAFDYGGRRFQCYTYWTTYDGSRLMARDIYPIDTPGIHRLAIRHSAGCLYARIRDYDDSGAAIGYRTVVVCVEASLLHGPPDNLYLRMWGHILSHDNPREGNVILPSFLSRDRPMFVQARHRAEIGFDQFCSEEPLGAAHSSGISFGADDEQRFLGRIDGLEWEAALGLVEEAWQLYLVCREIHPPEFAHRKTPYKRAKLLVESYCDRHPGSASFIRALWPNVSSQLLADQSAAQQ